MAEEKHKLRLDKDKTGKVYIYYSNYKINQGLSDDLFEDEKE